MHRNHFLNHKIVCDDEDNIPWAERVRQPVDQEDLKKKTKVVEVKKEETPDFEERSNKRKKAGVEETSSSGKKKKAGVEETSSNGKPVEQEDLKNEQEDPKKKKTKVEVKKEKTPDLEEKSKKRKKEAGVEETSSSGKKKKARVEETSSPSKKKKGEEDEEVWKWWEEDKREDGVKWKTLEHKGPVLAPPYIPLPKNVRFKYDGEVMDLSEEAEECASFYAKMLDHEYTSKTVFNKNFLEDWRKTMTSAERSKVKDLSKCDFKDMAEYYKDETEKRKNRSKEEKKAELELKKKEVEDYGTAIIDGHKQKIGNFRIEPPALFRGRGDHPKMGRLKKRIMPEDITINCSKGAKVPTPPPGHKWQGIVHDNTVTWLASWVENVQNFNKYIMLNPSSKLKGEKDWDKFETARKLKSVIGEIRENYQTDFKSHEMGIRQRAVALYFIDKLALRAGNEKDTEEAADTVGCCSLRCEHITLHEELDDAKYMVEFDFLGKDSIRYYNRVSVEKGVYKNLKRFMEGKSPGDDLFDRLDTSTLNDHLRKIMPELTAKVFRTYNASITLQEQLEKLTKPDDSINEKILSYNRANRLVAVLCNHQRAIPKTHEKSMENLTKKIKDKKKEVKSAKAELKDCKGKDEEKLIRKVERLKDQLKKLKLQHVDKDENKQIALGTSKLNYLDPRISIAWCKRYDVPVEKIFNKTHREKFRWAIEMADEDYVF